MTYYSLIVFLHVLGAVGMFAAWAVESVALRRLRESSTTAEPHAWMEALRGPGPLRPLSMLTVIATGVAMMVLRWGPRPWMLMAVLALVAIVIIGAGLGRKSARRLRRGAERERVDETAARLSSATALLALSLRLRVALGIGILGLMAIKPGLTGSWLIMGAAVASGLVRMTGWVVGQPVEPIRTHRGA